MAIKLIQSGELYVKLFRKKLSLVTPIYKDGEKIARVEKLNNDIFYFKPQYERNLKKYESDIIHIIRQMSLHDYDSISMRYCYLKKRRFTDNIKITIYDRDLYVVMLPEELESFFRRTGKSVEVVSHFDRVDDEGYVSLLNKVDYHITVPKLYKTDIYIYDIHKERMTEVDLSNSVLKIDCEARFRENFNSGLTKISFINEICHHIIKFKLPHITSSKGVQDNVVLNISNMFLLDVVSLKAFIEQARYLNIHVILYLYDVVERHDVNEFIDYYERMRKSHKDMPSHEDYIKQVIEINKIMYAYEGDYNVSAYLNLYKGNIERLENLLR